MARSCMDQGCWAAGSHELPPSILFSSSTIKDWFMRELPEAILITNKISTQPFTVPPVRSRQDTWLSQFKAPAYLKSSCIKMASMTNTKHQTAIAIRVCFLAFFASHHLLGRTP